MQSPEAGSDSAAPVALHPSAAAQAPVVQAVPASQQVNVPSWDVPMDSSPDPLPRGLILGLNLGLILGREVLAR